MRPGLLGLAVLLIALGGLGAAFAVTSVRATGTYLAIARPVAVGAELSRDDLMSVQVAGGQGLKPIDVDRIDEMLGKRAAVTLTPGTLLTEAQLTDEPMLGSGQQQLALGVKPYGVPSRKLRPGDKVQLMSMPAKTTDGRTTSSSTRFNATVVDSDTSDTSIVTVYLVLATRDVPAVVALAAEQRVAIVLTGSV
ncbi:SAF domain-containing protein [Micromonospora sp. WMMD882]|uniref:SAF domain-containing protein n=1 Tax=Micromonospora sp. WMMD882 TaxID=3015151 RepID=UPI00248B0B3B|nr:SAF domain-containing protein [Micromonospora sp. WMMD882]WBB82447.1 SAF domain-containing protein [Micromonospora sp. WMMD882]